MISFDSSIRFPYLPIYNYDVDFIIGSNHYLETEYQSPVGLSFDEHFDSLLIYSDNYICMGRKGNPFFKKGKIELQNYLDANHIKMK